MGNFSTNKAVFESIARLLQAQKQEQERIDREKMRKERPTETLVKNTFSGGAIEVEAAEIEGFIVDFEGTIENAKNIARYAKEVVGATGVTLTKKKDK
jgi:hypothetical protein